MDEGRIYLQPQLHIYKTLRWPRGARSPSKWNNSEVKKVRNRISHESTLGNAVKERHKRISSTNETTPQTDNLSIETTTVRFTYKRRKIIRWIHRAMYLFQETLCKILQYRFVKDMTSNFMNFLACLEQEGSNVEWRHRRKCNFHLQWAIIRLFLFYHHFFPSLHTINM